MAVYIVAVFVVYAPAYLATPYCCPHPAWHDYPTWLSWPWQCLNTPLGSLGLSSSGYYSWLPGTQKWLATPHICVNLILAWTLPIAPRVPVLLDFNTFNNPAPATTSLASTVSLDFVTWIIGLFYWDRCLLFPPPYMNWHTKCFWNERVPWTKEVITLPQHLIACIFTNCWFCDEYILTLSLIWENEFVPSLTNKQTLLTQKFLIIP